MKNFKVPSLPKGMFFRVQQRYNRRGEAYDWYVVELRFKTHRWWLRWMGSCVISERSTTRNKFGVHYAMDKLAIIAHEWVTCQGLVGDYPPKKL